MKYTTNLGLNLPESSDSVDIEHLNKNFKNIDNILQNHQDGFDETYTKEEIDNKFESLESVTIDQEYNPESANAQSGKALKTIFENRLAVWTDNTKYNKGQHIIADINMYDINGKFMYPYTAILCCMKDHISSLGDLDTSDFFKFNELWGITSQIIAKDANTATCDASGNIIHETYATGVDVAEAIKDKPTVYTGTLLTPYELAAGDYLATVKEPFKVGDIYINELDWNIYQFVEVVEENDKYRYFYKILNQTVEQSYNPNSSNAQSGKAVAEAIGNIETVLDGIITIQNSLIGGESV